MDASRHTEKKNTGTSRLLIWIVLFILVFSTLQFLFKTYFAEAYGVPSGSMESTIMTGDKLYAEQISFHFRSVAPGDIITFEDPEDPERTLIKRCIAVGGQTVDLQEGAVYIDGTLLSEPYVNGLPTKPLYRTSENVSYPYTVPEGCLWVMGDNRTNSQDSRYFGAVEESSVNARGFMIFWPLNHFGFLE